jgi:hypothetical protein
MNPDGGSLQASGLVYVGETRLSGSWYRQISPAQWRPFWATFLGWVVDAFDCNILAFILIDIQRSFSVARALSGALGTITLAMRVVGGIVAGTAADKFGRKLPQERARSILRVLSRPDCIMIRHGHGP